MKYTQFHEEQFLDSVRKALKIVATILDTERNPVIAADAPHTYDDKYILTEFLTNTAVASFMNALTALGLQPNQLQTLSEWVVVRKQSVTLRFLAEEACSFFKEEIVEVSKPGHEEHEIVTTKTEKSSGGASSLLFGSHASHSKEETLTTRVVHRVKEYHWKVGVRHKLVVFPGTSLEEAITLQQRSSETLLVTQQSPGHNANKIKAPLSEHSVHPPVDTSLTWFIKMISPSDQTCQFVIDRTSITCKTPRRNPNVQSAIEFCQDFYRWAHTTQTFFVQRVEGEIIGKENPVLARSQSSTTPSSSGDKDNSILEPGTTGVMQGLSKEPSFNGKAIRIIEYSRETQRYRAEPIDINSGLPLTLSIKPSNIKPDRDPVVASSNPPLSSITADTVFCPVLPLLENGTVLSMTDAGEFLQEQMRSLDQSMDALTKVFPHPKLVKLVSVAEASIVLLCNHMENLAMQYIAGMDYVECMLKEQLTKAIGKLIEQSDLENFMRFYYCKFFGLNYAPSPFSHAIRRPGRYPDGILSIEERKVGLRQPISTWVRSIDVLHESNPSIFIPIGAATSVEVTGDRYLHGWMQQRFSNCPDPSYEVVCRARQFSSFLVILGAMAGPDKFEPKNAIILQNKDEVFIPLMTNVLPSAKEFKDKIESLSPEQQAFANAYRSMQLESSVFGICVIQLKPQLEKLLGLPVGSLTKEIQLTQNLMTLFVEYQIPSDLVTFEGPENSTQTEKVDAVKQHVKAVLDMIDGNKQKQLKDEEMKADVRAEMNVSIAPSEVPKKFLRRNAKEPSPIIYSSYQPTPPSLLKQEPLSNSNNYPAPVSMLRSEMIQPGPTKDASSFPPLGDRAPKKAQDFTMIPKQLDVKLDKYDTDHALRSTILVPGFPWSRTRQENLLTKAKTSIISQDDLMSEKQRAYDLLDAISRSGTLPVECSELHIIVALSHCFENDVMGTVIQDNINPIEKLERSSLLLASTIYGQPAANLIHTEQDIHRLRGSFPLLLESSSESVAGS